MVKYVARGILKVDEDFLNFVENELAPYLGVKPSTIWSDIAALDAGFDERISDALFVRAQMQLKLDNFFDNHAPFDQEKYDSYLREIGYVERAPNDFQIKTENTDDEVAKIAAPQLVVPINNARFALNAANARWGSIYDALYGTNAIMDAPKSPGFDAARAAKVADYVREHLDKVAPLAGKSWRDIASLSVRGGTLDAGGASLADAAQFAGHIGDAASPDEILLRVNGLIIRIVRSDAPISKIDKAGIGDVIFEAALTTIMDCEDSVAAVDGPDKVGVYRNWLGLIRGDLEHRMEKNGKTMTRRLASDIPYTAPDGSAKTLKGRSLMFVRNVGHLMRSPAIWAREHQIFEGLMDAYFTIAIAAKNQSREGFVANSEFGSIYVVKPKMHGSGEVFLAGEIFTAVENMLGLKPNTVKIGIMDEERRTSVNLAGCIAAAAERVAFINTGFLDRTGDEIHTHMHAGAVVPKEQMRSTPWLKAYEKRNVEIGLAHGLQGRAQIGKGMWAKPDDMRGLLKEKIAHPEAGASTAWVPSPTAATLHALHYHLVNVRAVQDKIKAEKQGDHLGALLTPPLLRGENLTDEQIQNELENNLQGILGYVVRWVDQGIGCSTVPDIHDVGLMEDRATCRISAQMVANWLFHGLITEADIDAAFEKVAKIVDRQNSGDPLYHPLSRYSYAMLAARDLVFKGADAPSGYTEPTLHEARLALKSRDQELVQ